MDKINVSAYWIWEYVRVFAGYMLVMYLWPFIFFRKYLRNKGAGFVIAFCSTTMVVLLNAAILLLGLLGILNAFTFNLVFYGGFIYGYIKNYGLPYDALQKTEYYLRGSIGFKSLMADLFDKIKDRIRQFIAFVLNRVQGHVIEAIWLVLLLIAMLRYFSLGLFENFGYGFTDLYTHTEWVYGLTQGKVFSGGVYPEGMHCFVYAVRTAFGINTYSVMRLVASPHLITLFFSMYLFFSEIFKNRYTPAVDLVLFLMLDIANPDGVTSMSRLMYSLPQEFAFYAMFLCVAYGIRFFRSTHNSVPRIKYGYWNDDLYIFMMGLAVTMCVHFYPTIMVFFIFLAFVIAFCWRFFNPQRLVPVAVIALSGVAVAIVPMTIALAAGQGLQGSIAWALGVMEKDKGYAFNIGTVLSWIYSVTFEGIFGNGRAGFIAFTCVVALIAGVGGTAVLAVLRYMKKTETDVSRFAGYTGVTLAFLFLSAMYCARFLGLPYLIDPPRLISVIFIFMVAVMAVSVDIIFSLASLIPDQRVINIGAPVFTAVLYLVVRTVGAFHGNLYMSMTRLDEAVMVTQEITSKYPKFTYTIVSPTDDLYQLVEYGYHEELVDFINGAYLYDYLIPTEKIFIFLEKNSLVYAQDHFYKYPELLADNKYQDMDWEYASLGADIYAVPISDEFAEDERTFYFGRSENYKDIETRAILESKLAKWCSDFSEFYPGELKVFFEDDDFVCYYIEQNTQNFYYLGLWSNLIN